MDTSVLASNVSSATRFLKRNTLLIAFISGFTTPALALDWEIKNLGILPGAISSFGTALNDQGQVAGNMFYGTHTDEDGRVYTTQYSFLSGPNGGPLQLIDHGGPTDGYSRFHASEVNNAGQVTGYAQQGSSAVFGWVTGANGQGLQRVDFQHRGVDINDAGTVVYQRTFGGVTITEGNGPQQLVGESNEVIFAKGINNAGQTAITVAYGEDLNQYTGGIWSENVGVQPIFFQGSNTTLFDINNSGQVLGYVSSDPFRLLVLNPVSGAFNLIYLGGGTLAGHDQFESFGLPRFNDSGQIVGQYVLDGTTFSFLASATTNEVINLSMEQDLIAAGWSNIMVSDINNLGQISGTGTINGTTRAFLLTPVPEPETYAMMLAGLSVLGFMRRRKQHLSN
ncbi:MAG TPA: PEP-CTERM sorting domain-containing protein [Methylophilaceae bacterium]|nr:PEP-CTERM sorting domain-containing protein [Methylophilaceae bacterium]